MPIAANQAACGTATLFDGTHVAIVAGGFDINTRATIATTVMYDLDKEYWMTGPDLPRPLRYTTTVPTAEGSFLLIGGTDNEAFFDTIIEFDPMNVGWIVREEKMTWTRNRVFAVEVDSGDFC